MLTKPESSDESPAVPSSGYFFLAMLLSFRLPFRSCYHSGSWNRYPVCSLFFSNPTLFSARSNSSWFEDQSFIPLLVFCWSFLSSLPMLWCYGRLISSSRLLRAICLDFIADCECCQKDLLFWTTNEVLLVCFILLLKYFWLKVWFWG